MESRYITLIVRVRLDAPDSRRSTDRIAGGSLQRVGAQEIHYFNSFVEIPALMSSIAELAEPADRGPDDRG